MKKTKKQLRSEIIELKAQLASSYHFASFEINKLNTDKLMGSGVLVCLYYAGGKEATVPFMVKDGFSKKTIDALQDDISRSYELATAFKPYKK